jgi:hypothetical protein
MSYTVHDCYLERKLYLKEKETNMNSFLPPLGLMGFFVLIWCFCIFSFFVVYKKVPRYTLVEAREAAKKDTSSSITILLVFITAPVVCWFLFGKDYPQSFFIVVGCAEIFGLLLFLVEFTAARLAKKRIKELEASAHDEI